MSEYDFRNLSDYDFEVLLRDLLTEHLGLYFQGFKRGKDGGVDLRYCSSSSGNVIAQCKHYLRTPLTKLIRDAREEAKKLDVLKPSRYILATSLELSDSNKDSLLTALLPYCLAKDDIYSNQDINYLLSIYPQIEKRHPKLWLSSSAVLDKFINNDIISKTRILFEDISEDALKYVQNSSFEEARNILEEIGYCIISGIPGIGKTTLAKMLLLNYNMNGYEPVYISGDIDEAYRMLKPEKKQAIYFDDFLGKTKFNPISLNFDKRLIDFIKNVKRSENTIFILTTREYILNQAATYYEDFELNKSLLSNGKCIINLSDYTRGQKALILYNHLYHSAISSKDLVSINEEKNLYNIISHRNYLPRIIDWVIKNRAISTGSNLADKLLYALNNPRTIWKGAFERHISQSSKAILTLLFLNGDVPLENLRQSYVAYSTHLLNLRRISASDINFEDGLRELEGSFISINQHRHITFHNPSIIDYLDEFFQNSPDNLIHAVNSISSQKDLWRLIRKIYPLFKLSSANLSSLSGNDDISHAIIEVGVRLDGQIRDSMSLDEQKSHIENLKFASQLTKSFYGRSPIGRMLVNYISNLITKDNLLVTTSLDGAESLSSLSHLYGEIKEVKNLIDDFLNKNIDSIDSLELFEDILDMTRAISLPDNLKDRRDLALDRTMKSVADDIGDSFSSSNLTRFEEIYGYWEDIGFGDVNIREAMNSVLLNQGSIANGEVEDEDFEPEQDEDDEHDFSSDSFIEDVVDYDDIIDLIHGLGDDER